MLLGRIGAALLAAAAIVSGCCIERAARGTDWFPTLSQVQRDSIYWSADWETGDISQWEDGSPWVTGPGKSSFQVVTSPVHSGNFAMATTIDTRHGPAGVRWPVRVVPGQDTLPQAAYYSTWLRFDTVIDAPWYNVMQWKHTTPDGTWSDPTWAIGIGQRDDGRDYYYLYNFIGNDGNYNTPGTGRKADSAIPIPIGQWTHLETFYEWASDHTGSIICYQDGQLVFQQTGVRTKFVHPDFEEKPLQFAINAYGDEVEPAPSTIYFDDVAISQLRLGSPLASPPVPGDYSGNGIVDAADYMVWRDSRGQSGGWLAADGNANGLVDTGDYLLWRSHFGRTAAPAVASPTPEPDSAILAFIGLAAAIIRMRRRVV